MRVRTIVILMLVAISLFLILWIPLSQADVPATNSTPTDVPWRTAMKLSSNGPVGAFNYMPPPKIQQIIFHDWQEDINNFLTVPSWTLSPEQLKYYTTSVSLAEYTPTISHEQRILVASSRTPHMFGCNKEGTLCTLGDTWTQIKVYYYQYPASQPAKSSAYDGPCTEIEYVPTLAWSEGRWKVYEDPPSNCNISDSVVF